MENANTDINKLSTLYSKLDQLTSAEKGEVINYLVQSLIADSNKSTTNEKLPEEINDKLLTETTQKSDDIIEAVKSDTPDELKESNEQKEILSPEDIAVYIHGNVNGRMIAGEDNNIPRDYKDPLLKNEFFSKKYYSADRGNETNREGTHLLARDLGDGSTEYTIARPSQEGNSARSGYIGLSIILKHGFKIRDTGDLPGGTVRKDFEGDTSVASFMNAFMNHLIQDGSLTNPNINASSVQWKNIGTDAMRKVMWNIKSSLLKSTNEGSNDGRIVKDSK
ncbi:MAG: hypothetical protein NTX91_04680 [candidate division SR1 bacterium]|nr:hypothetical protein [candidate division SR1 bacterium]